LGFAHIKNVEKRYSDDLDFFTNQSARYSFAVKNIKRALQTKFKLVAEVESKDFTRFKKALESQVLRINLRVFRICGGLRVRGGLYSLVYSV